MLSTFTASVLVIVLYMVTAVYSQACDTSVPKTTTLRLKRDLLCNYNKEEEPPLLRGDKTTVGLAFSPLNLDFDETASILKLTTYTQMSWADARLKWDITQYDFIMMAPFDAQRIWVPDLVAFGTLDISTNTDEALSSATCIVEKEGQIVLIILAKYVVYCVSDWYDWPYDIHTCKMTMGSRLMGGWSVQFQFIFSTTFNWKLFTHHREWELADIKTKQFNDTRISIRLLKVTFTLKRHASVYVASYIFPVIVMIIVSLAIPWLDPTQPERISILCVLVILQSLFLQYIAYKLPSNSDRTPRVVSFFRDTLIVTGFLFIVTIVTRNMVQWTWKPTFLQTISNFLASSKSAKFIMMTNDDDKNGELPDSSDETILAIKDRNRHSQQWRMFSVLINRIAFFFVLCTYSILSLYLLR